MPKLYVLIGNIASGKSTWVQENCVNEKVRILSRDNLRYMLGWTDYVFNPEVEPHIQNIIKASLNTFIYLQDDIVLDETNISKRRRSWIFDHVPKDVYDIEAVVFPDSGMKKHVERRLQDDPRNLTVAVWESVYHKMHNNYEPPSFDEGFNTITYI